MNLRTLRNSRIRSYRHKPVLDLVGAVASGKTGRFAAGLVLALVVVAIFAPVVAPDDPTSQDVSSLLEGPSPAHWLGTDALGRDLLSRAVFGARIALGVALPASAGALLAGLLIGVVAGYFGGRLDRLLVVLMDTMQAVPTVILALALLALLGPSLRNVTVVVGVTFTPAYARMARASVFVVREEAYVVAERSLGATSLRILAIHVLPNIIGPLFILMTINIPIAVTIEAGLSFLGLGVPPPDASWGVMLADGFQHIRVAPWAMLVPAAALTVTTLGFTLLGETVRDNLDPRLSREGGRPGV